MNLSMKLWTFLIFKSYFLSKSRAIKIQTMIEVIITTLATKVVVISFYLNIIQK
jgi:uncharacterized Fe-S cluster-containing MiaB family protein